MVSDFIGELFTIILTQKTNMFVNVFLSCLLVTFVSGMAFGKIYHKNKREQRNVKVQNELKEQKAPNKSNEQKEPKDLHITLKYPYISRFIFDQIGLEIFFDDHHAEKLIDHTVLVLNAIVEKHGLDYLRNNSTKIGLDILTEISQIPFWIQENMSISNEIVEKLSDQIVTDYLSDLTVQMLNKTTSK